MSTTPSIIVIPEFPLQQEQAQQIAQQLQLPFMQAADVKEYPWVLIQQSDRLALRFPSATKPFAVDFMQTDYLRRLKQAGKAREPLVRAMGFKYGAPIRIIDGTAGWGSDAFLLATLGAQVIALERSPIVAALLKDGIRRAQQEPIFADLAITVEVVDTCAFLQSSESSYEIIYLDPMFPERPNSALVKKPLQLLQMLLGVPHDASDLVAIALTKATQRVVVKRPTWAQPLVTIPSFSVPGGMIRFDVYLI